MKYDEPIWGSLTCKECGNTWESFMPDGIDSDTVECPKCHKQVEICFAELDENERPYNGEDSKDA